eukprot:1379482-Amorphochlora_amoeboformis.AAC.1
MSLERQDNLLKPKLVQRKLTPKRRTGHTLPSSPCIGTAHNTPSVKPIKIDQPIAPSRPSRLQLRLTRQRPNK